MPVELNTTIDQGAMEISATYVNRVQVSVAGPNVRISFGEVFGPTTFHYRLAVAMNIQDATEFARVLLRIIEQTQGAVPIPQRSGVPSSPTMASSPHLGMPGG